MTHRMLPEDRHEAKVAIDECVASLCEAARAIDSGLLERAREKLEGIEQCVRELGGAIGTIMAGEQNVATWRALAEQGRRERQRGGSE